MNTFRDNKEELEYELSQYERLFNEIDQLKNNHNKIIDHLRKIEEKYEFIVNAYGEFMSLINRDYIYEAVNDAYCKAYNKIRNEIVGKTVSEVWNENIFVNTIKPFLDECFKGKEISYETSFVFGEKKETRHYAVSYYPYYNATGEVTHAVTVTRDITDKKIAELELIESEKRLKILNAQKDEYLRIIDSDLDRAYKYVVSLLPQPVNNNKISVDWEFIPSSKLGGDAFGYNWLDNDNFAFFVLDVSGHGVSAAIHSVSISTILKYKTLPDTNFFDPVDVLTSLNKIFQMADYNELYFTMWYCIYNRKTKILNYAGASHPPLIIFQKDGSAQKIPADNFFIGYISDYEYVNGSIKVDDDSVLYLYSDGAYEIKDDDGKYLSVDDLIEFLQSHSGNSDELLKLYNHLCTINNGALDDDFLIMKIKT